MKNRILFVFCIFTFVCVLFVGCYEEKYEPVLPDQYLELSLDDWQSPNVEEDNCGTFTYDNRQYLFYSYARRTLKENDVSACLGCTVHDGEIHKDEIIIALSYNDTNDYMAIYHLGSDFMGIAVDVYRAVDTKGENIEQPDFVEVPIEGNPMYQYWKVK